VLINDHVLVLFEDNGNLRSGGEKKSKLHLNNFSHIFCFLRHFMWVKHLISCYFQIILEAKSSHYERGGVAVDDISLSPGCGLPSNAQLPTPLTTLSTTPMPSTTIAHGTCANDQFQCVSDMSCISQDKICDFRNDCTDNSDEKNCGKLVVQIV